MNFRSLFQFITYLNLIIAFENKIGITKNADYVSIDNVTQEKKVKIAEELCNATISSYVPPLNANTTCPPRWDKIMCWPATPVDTKVFLDCPDYINKFNKRNKAHKTCYYNATLNRLTWSKTIVADCLPPKDPIDWKSLDKHYRYMLVIRIVGYIISMMSLFFSIAVMAGIKYVNILSFSFTLLSFY